MVEVKPDLTVTFDGIYISDCSTFFYSDIDSILAMSGCTKRVFNNCICIKGTQQQMYRFLVLCSTIGDELANPFVIV